MSESGHECVVCQGLITVSESGHECGVCQGLITVSGSGGECVGWVGG